MARPGRADAAALRLADDGFTLVELLVTISMILVSMVGMVSVFDGSRSLTSTAEETETATHQAEREMERILSLPYDSIALKSVPATSPDTNNPSFFVTQGPPARYRWDQGPTGPQSGDLVVDAAKGDLDPSAISWSDTQSRQQGSIHRFVTWTGDLSTATGTQRAKRITVAVTVTDGKRKKPLLISSIKVDPESAVTN